LIKLVGVGKEYPKMPRKKIDSIPVTFRMDEKIFDRLDKYCENLVLSRSRVINAALDHFTSLSKEEIVDLVMKYAAAKK
jgi:predicted transcriptional regulator